MPGITNSPDATDNFDVSGADFYGASAAITGKKGAAILSPVASPPGALQMTLAAPIAGTDDGKSLRIWSMGAYAHTVTCPAGGINGTSHLLTFTAAANNFVTLLAISGSWYITGNTNVTAS
jgi:hypothetical protein